MSGDAAEVYERLTEELLGLDEIEQPGREEEALAEVITTLIENYEGGSRRHKCRPPHPSRR